ncbi:MAG: hypothetical protein M3Y64_06390, partial [Gemmatimonadota bacterium]|nr:hypothetical protein [Gemmatimonadota bacterium]
NVHDALVAARAEAVHSGNAKDVEKLDLAITKLDRQLRDNENEAQVPKVPVAPQAPLPPGLTASTGNPYRDNYFPPQVVDIVQALGTTLVFCVVGFPLARAFARWIDRRGVKPPVPPEVLSRLDSIEKAVESVAVEVERISEGQRFTTKLLNDRSREPVREFAGVDGDPVVALPTNARRS